MQAGTEKRDSGSHLEKLNVFAISLLRQNTLQDLLWDMVRNIGELLHFEDCVIYLREGDFVVQRSAHGMKSKHSRTVENPLILKLGEGIVGTVAATGKLEMVLDPSNDPRFVRDLTDPASELAVPINYQGKVIGVIDSESDSATAFGKEVQELLQSMANIAASRIASAQEEEQRRAVESELRRSRDDLEKMVAARTKALTSAIRKMCDESEQRLDAQAQLRQEKERLKATLRSIGEGVIATDSNGRVEMLSDRAAELCGQTHAEAMGRQIDALFQPLDEHGEPLLLKLSGEGELTQFGELTTRSGDFFPIAMSCSKIKDERGEQCGMVVAFRDISGEQKLQDEVLKHQKMESIGVLAGGIAHDFNNLLSAILGGVNLAQLSAQEDEEISESLQLAERGCLRARGLTKQLLTFSRDLHPHKQVGDLVAVLDEAVEFALHGSKIQCTKEIADLPAVNMDKGQLIQVFNNLLINAVQAMPDSGDLRIVAASEQIGGMPWVVIRIEDTGVGIEAVHLNRIFDPYYTTKAAGSGLGLASCYWIIDRHKGTISATSKLGEGTCFEIRLPAHTGVRPEASRPRSSPRHQTGRVLIMDDDSSIRHTTSKMLTYLGMQSEVSNGGDQALTLVRKSLAAKLPFDLAILDLTIPGGIGGKEVVGELKRLSPHTKVIVASGYSNDPVMANHGDYGFDSLLEKPYTLPQLGEVITSVLESEEPAGFDRS